MIPTEYVCEINEQQEVLQRHFQLFYQILAENKSNRENDNGVTHHFSGSPNPYHNAVIGCPLRDWDVGIAGQMEQFNKLPFVWFVDEKTSQEFKDKLLEHGFKDTGLFQGVIGSLDQNIPTPQTPLGCVLERVQDEETMKAFNELVCATLGIPAAGKDSYQKANWKAAQGNNPKMYHWIAKKEGIVVSTLTTLIDEGAVSFWNGATRQEYRCHGINTALRYLALKDAVSKGCVTGISYLMADGMSFGICKKLGFRTKWRFHAYLSPSAKNMSGSLI